MSAASPANGDGQVLFLLYAESSVAYSDMVYANNDVVLLGPSRYSLLWAVFPWFLIGSYLGISI